MTLKNFKNTIIEFGVRIMFSFLYTLINSQYFYSSKKNLLKKLIIDTVYI